MGFIHSPKTWNFHLNQSKAAVTWILSYHMLFLHPHKQFALPVRTKQQFYNALALHITLALIKPEFTSGLLICHFLRPALQRKSHWQVQLFFCWKNAEFCFQRDTLDNQSCNGLSHLSTQLFWRNFVPPPTPPSPQGAHLRLAYYHSVATQPRWQQPATGDCTQ